ncbi:MAG TPA: hypothetical protein DCO78_05940 [Chitinophagaceae bacterium]|nr:hypothetical protein [Chitinophagaceae bacterium]
MVLLSATYLAGRTQMSNRICFELLSLTSAAVPGWTFFKCPAERKAVAVIGNKATGTILSNRMNKTFLPTLPLPLRAAFKKAL